MVEEATGVGLIDQPLLVAWIGNGKVELVPRKGMAVESSKGTAAEGQLL